MKRTFFAVLTVLIWQGAISTNAQRVDESIFKGLEFRSIGPAVMGGRIDDLAVDENNPSSFYVGSAAGGIWKTTNNGTTWTAVFDNEGVGSIGDVTLAPSNPDIVWAGTGEANNRQSSSFGDGVYKSIDGGRTWNHMGLRDSQSIGRIVIDPRNPDIVYVAALGHLWGPNRERGLYKTTDGGATWTNTNFINEDTGFTDVAMDPANSQILYAAAYQRRRTAWGYNGGGPGSGLYKTVDGGRTWKKLANGLPSGIVGRIGIGVSRKNPSVMYATVEHRTNGGIYRSEDRGETWQKVNSLNPRPMYYSQIVPDPNDENHLYVLGSTFFVSKDGGKTFADPKTGKAGANTTMSAMYDVGVHGDHHALWVDPKNSNHLILGNDGGLYYSYDASITWDKVNNFPLAQFYAIGVDMQKPYTICGGLQDTHSWCGPSATRRGFGIMNSDWHQVDFGDGMYAQPDPDDPTTLYIEASGGSLTRVNMVTGDRKAIKPVAKSGEPAYRFNWTPPIHISPHNSKTIYFGGNQVFKSTDRGETWTASPDLTKAQDRDKIPIIGVMPSTEMLSRNDGVGAWGTITTIAESPVSADVLWAGTDDGNVQLSRDGGKTWTNASDRISGISKDARVTRVEPSHKDAGTAYVSLDRHQWDDFHPYIYVTTDYGRTWKPVTEGLSTAGWVNVVKEHPGNANVLFAGTETGLYVSFNHGTQWTRLKNNLPTVPVDDLVIHPRDNDLIVATHGRALYVMDDVTAFNELTPEVLNSESYLFQPRTATVQLSWKSESYVAQREFQGPNPPSGVLLTYYLRSAPSGEVKVAVLDASGKVIREITAAKNAGLNRVVWDFRVAGPEGVAGGRGPFVLPGKYTVRLSAGGRDVNRTVDVEHDAQMPVTDAERRSRFTFLTSVNALQGRLQTASNAVSTINASITSLSDNFKKTSGTPPEIVTAASAIGEKGRDLQRRIGQQGGGGDGDEGGGGGGGLRGRINGLFTEIDGNQPAGPQQGTLTGPTEIQTQRLQETTRDLNALVDELNTLITTSIPDLTQRMNRANVAVFPTLQPLTK